MKKILFVGAEVMPFAATGGLGDVLGSLPSAITEASGGKVDVRVVMPLYGSVSSYWREQMSKVYEGEISLSWRRIYCGIYSLVKDGVTYYFVDNEYYFNRGALYGYHDEAERFAYFSKVAAALPELVGFYPDIVHAHDWSSALTLIYINQKYRHKEGYYGMKLVYTIHNIEYQGQYDFAILGDVFELDWRARNTVEYDGCINLMKGAIASADVVTTVSPRYADEICSAEYAHGLDRILRDSRSKLLGILNGIDYNYYAPEKDNAIAVNYTADELDKKYENKLALQRELGLPERTDVPMIAIISRLASHKGFDIISQMIYNVVGKRDVQLVLLGKGEAHYEGFFKGLEGAYPDKVRALITYDRDLSKRIYAASDIFLMPSKSEPCGLSQMIASRYGSIPVVRETGGLYDSIKPYWVNDGELCGNGFTFANYSPYELEERTYAAIDLWNDWQLRERFVKKIMNIDFSWKNSAEKYLEMYAPLWKKRK